MRRWQPGLTLLEVIVALALMGTVLVSSILAFSSHRRQLSVAQKRLEAIAIADELLARLQSQQGGVPVPSSGLVVGKPGWNWQTSVVGTTTIATVPLQVIRFEVNQTAPNRISVGLPPSS